MKEKEEKIKSIAINIPGIELPIEFEISDELWVRICEYSRENSLSTEQAIIGFIYNTFIQELDDEEENTII